MTQLVNMTILRSNFQLYLFLNFVIAKNVISLHRIFLKILVRFSLLWLKNCNMYILYEYVVYNLSLVFVGRKHWAVWVMMHHWPVYRASSPCPTSTSSNYSRRSPTRPSTPSGNSCYMFIRFQNNLAFMVIIPWVVVSLCGCFYPKMLQIDREQVDP